MIPLLLALLSADPVKVEFEYPIFLTVGPDRSLYIADQEVPAIYKITAEGKLSTVYRGKKFYRTPLYRPRGLALDSEGNLYIADPATMDVYQLSQEGKLNPLTGKPVKLLNKMDTTMGEFVQPEGVAVAKDGIVYVSDLKLRGVFKIVDRKPVLVAEVPAPRGMVFDADGSLVVVSNSDAQLKRVTLSDGKVTNIVGARPFDMPISVCLRSDGNYVVTDNYKHCLWLVTREGKASKLVEGEPLKNPTSVWPDSQGNLAIADPHKKSIFWLSAKNEFTTAAQAK